LGDTCIGEKVELAVEETGGIMFDRRRVHEVCSSKYNNEQLCCITS